MRLLILLALCAPLPCLAGETIAVPRIDVPGKPPRPGAVYVLPRARVDLDELRDDPRHRVLSRWNDGSPQTVETRLSDGARRQSRYRRDGTREWMALLDARDKHHGKTIRWHPNRVVFVVEQWEHGTRVGEWVYYGEDGAPRTKLLFTHGVESTQLRMGPDGRWQDP